MRHDGDRPGKCMIYDRRARPLGREGEGDGSRHGTTVYIKYVCAVKAA